MLGPSVLLLLVGLLGAFDIAYFHSWKGRLVARAECRTEVWIHVLRGFVYAIQFVVVPNVEFHGRWVWALAALFAVDVVVGVSDILVEPESRASQGGISGPEYLIHMILSVLVGGELYGVARTALGWVAQPSELVFSSHVPDALRLFLAVMAVGSLACALLEAALIHESTRPAAAPLHVRVRLAATLERVWNVTQDHRLHPTWDHRFDRIVMDHETDDASATELGTPDPRIQTGTTMRYEKTLLGMTIRGYGRYKLHKPMRQSTFEFGSSDPRSLIEKGVGLWLYTDLGDGRVEMSTSYTYEPRWGLFGRLFDRWVFRPAFQRYTEASFRRLARRFFAEERPHVLGREGRRPEHFTTSPVSC
ncbi:hypothetical protein AKJ09_00611 [Labilithrix luteola]|uniref:Uncharacterized protein n=1 Tax=Labilithrix luteola TaxID=1391654 RepID=A0A0K1PKA3_9BACT|nr:SRPBCC family protein [Labilithrix luteola]AKU93947.1 hypothetical protein AKJ09_00611 [Labilithrix luteola]